MNAIEELRAKIPEHSKDIKINLQNVLSQSKLSPSRAWGCAVASAIAARHLPLAKAVLSDARATGIDDAVIDDAQAAASLMAMNNVYYRFKHFAGEAYAQVPARLRMQRIARPAAEKVDFELYSLAVSAINGCETCVVSHEKVVREAGLSADEINDAVRIAATMQAAAVALEQAELS